ncbi:hypothetical protein [Cellulosimicrobium cellulans]|uniref:hypothetical protein n=1 Tax=Cellulosimicrobium cellulans TaxID=1710 RepID=UPI0008492007|nr:hypothetical protein [Cellulosimicrobium cellulans]
MEASDCSARRVADPPEWSRDAARAAAAYRELRDRLGERLVDEERTSEHGHAHWDAYRLAMEDPSLHRLLLDVLRGEPDQVMALSPVLAVVDGDDPALARSALDVLVPGSKEQRLAEQRAHDVAVVRAAAAGDAGSEEPADTWSPWAQGRASSTATDLRVLDRLTADGFSRRVRVQARDRARRLRRTAERAARGPGPVGVDGPGAS